MFAAWFIVPSMPARRWQSARQFFELRALRAACWVSGGEVLMDREGRGIRPSRPYWTVNASRSAAVRG